MSFLRRRKPAAPPPPAPPLAEEVSAHQFTLKMTYQGRSSDGLRAQPGGDVTPVLAHLVDPLALSPVEVIEPLPVEFGEAAPAVERFAELEQWVRARRDASPIGRHALAVLELTDTLDMTVDTFVCALLHGETDTSGVPDYAAIVGGLASHWDELSGELIVRAVVGWGGRGLRGDTERIGQRLLNSLYQQVLASDLALGRAEVSPAATPGQAGRVCSHCGFDAGVGGAFYCPKCGMRMARGA
ncbi:MAG TPA: hypothetical protein VJA85_04010 [Candidatus Limnocylindria bacterium]|nr:hypothetical protein [Candidatus Limnocylindria bacterium]